MCANHLAALHAAAKPEPVSRRASYFHKWHEDVFRASPAFHGTAKGCHDQVDIILECCSTL
jgi:hypothetical protein